MGLLFGLNQSFIFLSNQKVLNFNLIFFSPFSEANFGHSVTSDSKLHLKKYSFESR